MNAQPLSQVVESAPAALARAALDAFDRVVQSQPGLRSRPGQRQMAEQVARTFSEATLGGPRSPDGTDTEVDDSLGAESPMQRRVAVIQAGTGVGKSLAYAAPAIALALARNTRVLIATATVALQEQLVNKDLPVLAASLEQPFRFALAKGRGRYVCRLKLERLLGDAPDDDLDDLFADLAPPAASAAGQPAGAGRDSRPAPNGDASDGPGSWQAQRQLARTGEWQAMAQALATETWDGDRDNLPTTPEPDIWLPVAAEAASCTGKHCPLFGRCTYFERRKELVGAQVIVANHDLLLSSLGARVLPELDNCLLVLDEAHHLPSVALDQFTRSMDLTRLRWIDQLAQRALQVGAALYLSDALESPQHAAKLRLALQELARYSVDTLRHGAAAPAGTSVPGATANARSGTQQVRLPKGELPEGMAPMLEAVQEAADAWLVHLAAMARVLKAEIKDKPEDARRLSNLYAQMGTVAPRLEAVADTTRLLLAGGAPGEPPVAKWFVFGQSGEHLTLRAFASPTLPGTVLRQQLWPRVRAAVLTSATLTSCGRFDFFLAEAGLPATAANAAARSEGEPANATDPTNRTDSAIPTVRAAHAVRTDQTVAIEVPSPFNFAEQGRFEVVSTRADPRDAAAFTADMVRCLLADLAQVRSGALVLFTSRDQMRHATDRLPDRLRPYVLVQGEWPRTVLLQRHAQAVGRGEPSIIFGMQSFGEGLDLPGELCATLFIAKLPFAPPDDPVGEARAEWLQAQGRNPFMELTVPATSVRLAQWAGRAIRTETDQAHIICYDRRLITTPYGQRLLQGLPPFTQVRRD